MRKKILGGIAIAAVAAFNVSLNSQNNLSDISLANVEALAGNESGDSKIDHGCESCTSSQGYAGVVFHVYQAVLTVLRQAVCQAIADSNLF